VTAQTTMLHQPDFSMASQRIAQARLSATAKQSINRKMAKQSPCKRKPFKLTTSQIGPIKSEGKIKLCFALQS
jgi:hypothetical protein